MRASGGSGLRHALVGLMGLCAALAPAAQAGGPLGVSLRGQPAAWPANQTIGYRIDPGPLGRFGHDDPASWVAEGFQLWQSVQDARLSLADRGALVSDITERNILSFLQNPPRGVVSVIFDTDGKALDAVFGRGAGTAILGIGGPVITTDFLLNGRVNAAWTILNGRGLSGFRSEMLRNTITHELGHTLGLDHSQINAAEVWDGIPDNGDLAPCMSYYWGPNTPPHLARDDRATVAAFYPNASFAGATGTIRGRVLLADGVTPVQGLNVIARRVGDEKNTAVSVLSGYRFKGDNGLGSRDPQLWGLYEIRGLPPGTYRVAVEPLALTPAVRPHMATFPGARRFWQESPSDDPLAATDITVAAGQVLSGKDIRLPGTVTAPEAVNEAEPNDDEDGAQSIPLQAVIAGHADPGETGSLPQPLPGGGEDTLQDWYRLTLTEASLVTAVLTARNGAADLNLYLIGPGVTSSELRAHARSIDPVTLPETLQIWLRPGEYFLGVSAPTEGSSDSDYTLRVTTVAAPEETAATGPTIQALLVGDITDTTARVTWQTDQPANSTVLTGPYAPFPYLTDEFGSAELTRDHSITVTGLSPGAVHYVAANSRSAEGVPASPETISFLPSESLIVSAFATAAGTPSAGLPQVAAHHSLTFADPARPKEQLVVLLILNAGGPATDVRLDEVTPSSGWSLAGSPVGPFQLGRLGTRAAAQAMFRLRPTSGTPGGSPSLRLRGSYARPDGTRGTFNL